MFTQLPQFIVDSDGNKTAIILSLAVYEKLLADLHDLAIIAERQAETTLNLDDLRHKLEDFGVLQPNA